APRAKHFFAVHAKAVVVFYFHIQRRNGIEKTRPTGAGLKLIAIGKQIGATTDALVNALPATRNRALLAEGTFGAGFARDMKLFGCEDFSPFLIRSYDAVNFLDFPCFGVIDIDFFWHCGTYQ